MFGGCCPKNSRQNMMEMYPMPMPQSGQMEQQVVEPTITKCIEQEFYHEIPHVCPIHTHTINKHIYKHTYTPQFSCSEENQVCNIDCGKCSQFM
ncbi:MAG: hypothetical protein ACK5HP_01970 [Bacilli bacterium]